MVLLTPHNMPATAPQIPNINAALTLYIAFSQRDNAGKEDLYRCLTTAGAEREQFLAMLNASTYMESNRFIVQNFE